MAFLGYFLVGLISLVIMFGIPIAIGHLFKPDHIDMDPPEAWLVGILTLVVVPFGVLLIACLGSLVWSIFT